MSTTTTTKPQASKTIELSPEATLLLLVEWAFQQRLIGAAKRLKSLQCNARDESVAIVAKDDAFALLVEKDAFLKNTAREETPRILAKLRTAIERLEFLVADQADEEEVTLAKAKVDDYQSEVSTLQEKSLLVAIDELNIPLDLKGLRITFTE